MEEANRKESELRERLEEAEASAAKVTETLTASVTEAEAALKESEEKRLAVSDKVQGHSAQLDKATEEMAHHKSKRLVAKVRDETRGEERGQRHLLTPHHPMPLSPANHQPTTTNPPAHLERDDRDGQSSRGRA